MSRIYLDNAATSWPKPDCVYEAVDRYQREIGAPAGRSAYRDAGEAERMLVRARQDVARLLGVGDARRLVFTSNGTDSLNLAIHGLVRPGDHVVTTVCEHNSVLRPLRWLEDHAGVKVTRVGCDAEEMIDPQDIVAALRPDTRLVALIHASNVTGAVQPIEDSAAIVRDHPAFLLLDAAQSAGHLPIDFDALGCDLLAAPGHKGLLAPLGTGVLAIRAGVEAELNPVRQGGTGTRSEDDRQPMSLPDRYEAGNHNMPGIAGLGAAARFLLTEGVADLHERTMHLVGRLLDGLAQLENVILYGPRDLRRRVGVVSFNIAGYEPQEVAAALDAAHGIQVRAGIHCAPQMHAALGTLVTGGTVRFSLGIFNTEPDVEQAIMAVAELAESALPVE